MPAISRIDINPNTKGKPFKQPIAVGLKSVQTFKIASDTVEKGQKILVEKADFVNWKFASYFKMLAGAQAATEAVEGSVGLPAANMQDIGKAKKEVEESIHKLNQKAADLHAKEQKLQLLEAEIGSVEDMKRNQAAAEVLNAELTAELTKLKGQLVEANNKATQAELDVERLKKEVESAKKK